MQVIGHNEVNLIRDAAILLEHDNLDLAHGLMSMAQRARPEGTVIEAKVKRYRARMEEDRSRVLDLVQSGTLAIVPAGFRCGTQDNLNKALGLNQASLPFDSGFFPPSSIARVLETRQVALSGDQTTHQVCTKHEGARHGNRYGIEFRSSSYEKIQAQVLTRDQPDINNLLDSTFGYYTLDKVNGFVLAHYNWHHFANEAYSKGVHEPALNLSKINLMMNSRIKRMFNMCDRAQKILFVLGEFQSFDFMAIDDEVHDLTDIKTIRNVVAQNFGARALVARFQEIDTATKLLALIAS